MRKGFLLILAVAGLGFAATYFYLQRTPPPPPPAPAPPAQARPSPIAKTTSPSIAKTTPRPRNLASDGTYFLLRYHSVATDTGVTGFPPGTKVSLVGKSGQTIRVTDGQVEFDVSAGEVTNNLDIAARLARTDSRTQEQAIALASAQSNSLWIVQSSWGSPGNTVDVTSAIKKRVAAGDRTITAGSNLGGNSASRATKTLVITYAVGGGAPITETARQGRSIRLPSVPLAGK
jgi:hypothetical protein